MMIRKTLAMAAVLMLSGAAFAEKGPDSVASTPVPDGCTAIPDAGYTSPTNGTTGMVCRTITVAAGTINNPEIVLGMNHTWIGDVTVKVIPPSGAPIVTLFNRPGQPATLFGSSADFAQANPITFRDSSTNDPEVMGTGLTATQAVCRDGAQLCNFRTNRDAEVLPNVTNLAALNGQAAGGNWQVCVGDSATGDTGSLCTATITAGAAGPVGPTYTVSPTSHNFGGTELGTSRSTAYTLTNTSPAGGAALTVSGCVFGGANPSDFSLTNPPPAFPFTIPVGFFATGDVTFTPSQPGARSATLTCTTNAAAPNTTFTVTLSGTGTVPFIPVPTVSAVGQWTLLALVLGMGMFFVTRRQG